MCPICQKIPLRPSFRTPADYLACLEQLRELVGSGAFALEEASCPLDEVRDGQGRWADDIICHVVRCRGCGQCFSCVCNTYRGGGGFRKGR